MSPLMTINGDDVMEASLLRPVKEESGPSPTPEEETTLLGKGNGLSGAQGPAPLQAEIPSFIEPAEQTTAPVTSTVPHSCPSLKTEESWEKIDINPNNSGQWVQAYLERDSQLPEWWEEFCPLVCSTDRHCDDTQAKNMACQQAVAFCLVAAQKKVHGAWITPPCLSVLKRKEYLRPNEPWITQDYWEVQKEETVMLAIVLQWCAISVKAPPDVVVS